MQDLKDKANRLVGTRDKLRKDSKELLTAINLKEARKEAIELAQAIINTTAKETQEQLKFHLEDLVQTAIDAVFPNVYTFHIAFELKRGQTEGRIYLDKDGEELDPLVSCGGGVTDVVAFALRVACLVLSTNDRVLLMDEGFKWLSVGLRPLAGQMLKGLSEKLNLQVIMVTHDEEMIEVADKVFKVGIKQRRSQVEVL